MVDRRNLTLKNKSQSLLNKWLGPFTVTEVISRHVYKLDIPSNYYLHNVIHTSLLKPFQLRPDWLPQNETGLEFDQEDIEYEMESIIDSKQH